MLEPKRAAFLRLAQRRTQAVLDRIRILSNCANPYAYNYTEEEVRKIFETIDQELVVARSKFQKQKREFRLP